MKRQTYTKNQIVQKLKETEILIADGMTIRGAVSKIGISGPTYYKWRKTHGKQKTKALNDEFLNEGCQPENMGTGLGLRQKEKEIKNVVETITMKGETEEEYSDIKKSDKKPTVKELSEVYLSEESGDRYRKKGKTRRSVSGGDVLVAPIWAQDEAKKHNLVLRFVTDKGSRVADMEESGYTIMRTPEGANKFPGKQKAGDASPTGSIVERVVNQGAGEKGILMGIPKDWYEETQRKKEEEIKRTEEGIRKGAGVENAYALRGGDGVKMKTIK